MDIQKRSCKWSLSTFQPFNFSTYREIIVGTLPAGDFGRVERAETCRICGDTPRKGLINAENAKVIYAKNAKTLRNLCDLCVTIFATFAWRSL